MPRLIEKSASELISMIKRKEVTSVEVSQAFIDRIIEVNPLINAIHDFDPSRILTYARLADEAVNRGDKLGKLHGLPISLKDAFYAPGFKGSKGVPAFFKASPVDKCATVVRRLLDEGAIILGITNVPEFAASFEADNLIYGRTNNPYNLSLTPGGSSGGEAALIAAGCSPLGIGSDAGGSVRQPAHNCGISAFKPSRGVVPLTGSITSDSPGLHKQLLAFGPMARHVEDLELAFSIMRGADGLDSETLPVVFPESSSVDVKSLRIAFFFDNGIVTPSPEIVQAIRAAITQLEGEVASIEEKTPALIENSFRLVWETFFWGGDKGESLDRLFTIIGHHEFSPLFQAFLGGARATEFSVADLRQRFIEVEQFRTAMFRFMESYDILICPVAASLALPHGKSHEHIKDFSYTMAFNLTGGPVTVIPCGISQKEIPIGMQIAAKPYCDHISLALAAKLQKKLGVLTIPEPSTSNVITAISSKL